MTTLKWAVATAMALVVMAVVLRLVLWILTPLVPWLIVGIFLIGLLTFLLRGR